MLHWEIMRLRPAIALLVLLGVGVAVSSLGHEVLTPTGRAPRRRRVQVEIPAHDGILAIASRLARGGGRSAVAPASSRWRCSAAPRAISRRASTSSPGAPRPRRADPAGGRPGASSTSSCIPKERPSPSSRGCSKPSDSRRRRESARRGRPGLPRDARDRRAERRGLPVPRHLPVRAGHDPRGDPDPHGAAPAREAGARHHGARRRPRAHRAPAPHARLDHRARGGGARRDAHDLRGVLEPAQARRCRSRPIRPCSTRPARSGARSPAPISGPIIPYNTYRNAGLPPGPIASPGLAAIEAALDPAPVKYLYFVAMDDSHHHFSATIAEHNAAVARYRLARAR